MIFIPKHILKIINGTKTETRRIVKPGEEHLREFVMTPNGNVKWRVRDSYAVQPGRGKPCHIHNGKPLRIKILSIHREPLQAITRDGAWLEGITGASSRPITDYRKLWDSINKRPGTRWDDNPQVWVIKFEVLK